MSLRFKIILAFILCIVFAFSPLIYILQTQVKSSNMLQMQHHTSQLIDSKANEIGSWLNQRISEINIMIEYPSVKKLDFPKLIPYLTDLNKKLQTQDRSLSETFAIGGLDGIGWINSTMNIDISDRQYFKDLIQTKEPYIISNPIISKSDNMPIFLISYPILDDMNNKIGFINGSISLDKVSQIAYDIDIYDGFSWIMNKNKDVYSIDKETLINTYISTEGLDRIIADSNIQSSNVIKMKNLSNKDTSVFYSSIPYTHDWILCTMVENSKINDQTNRIISLIINLVVVFIFVAILASIFISGSIVKPIQNLKYNMLQVSQGNLNSYYSLKNKDEVSVLGNVFNQMVDDIKSLIQKVYDIETQKRTAELKTLQSQINPHFLYNTLDTAQWKSLEHGAFEVADIINSLSMLFRISLSDGKEFITIDSEVEHASNYLEIQKIRYKDKINHTIQVDDSLRQYLTPKLIIQPLVENSIYHGLKMMKGNGHIDINIFSEDMCLKIQVKDNGLGIPPDKLILIKKNLQQSIESEHYGLYNINERLRLTFGEKYQIQIESEYRVGTKVLVTIPLISEGFECLEY